MTLMCVDSRCSLDMFLDKRKCVYDLTSTFPFPDPTEKQEGKFLGRCIHWRSDGLTYTGDVKFVEEALEECDM